MKKIEAVISPAKLEDVIASLMSIDAAGLTIVEVRSRGGGQQPTARYRGAAAITVDLVPHLKLEIVVPDFKASQVVEAILRAARTGQREEGRIVVSRLDDVLRIRTGETGEAAI